MTNYRVIQITNLGQFELVIRPQLNPSAGRIRF
jgi:hypothetical protein